MRFFLRNGDLPGLPYKNRVLHPIDALAGWSRGRPLRGTPGKNTRSMTIPRREVESFKGVGIGKIRIRVHSVSHQAHVFILSGGTAMVKSPRKYQKVAENSEQLKTPDRRGLSVPGRGDARVPPAVSPVTWPAVFPRIFPRPSSGRGTKIRTLSRSPCRTGSPPW